ncbi:fatty acid desaturase [Nocardia asteroides]|uniref:fatty acid desaturase n=1 Tax=Nocardia asteroides TaxID=1824 RepID=UPI0033D16BC3
MTDTRIPGPARTPRATGDDLLNIGLVALAVTAGVSQLFVVPLLLARDPAWGWLLVPLTLTTTPFWSLIHEAIHGSLLRDRTHNDRTGRALTVLYGSPFAMLKAGHLLHHRYSRVRERTEIYDPARTSWLAAAPRFYLTLLGGLYLLEVLALLLAPLPGRANRRAVPDHVRRAVLPLGDGDLDGHRVGGEDHHGFGGGDRVHQRHRVPVHAQTRDRAGDLHRQRHLPESSHCGIGSGGGPVALPLGLDMQHAHVRDLHVPVDGDRGRFRRRGAGGPRGRQPDQGRHRGHAPTSSRHRASSYRVG